MDIDALKKFSWGNAPRDARGGGNMLKSCGGHHTRPPPLCNPLSIIYNVMRLPLDIYTRYTCGIDLNSQQLGAKFN